MWIEALIPKRKKNYNCANNQEQTATATDLSLISPPLSAVRGGREDKDNKILKIMDPRKNIHMKKKKIGWSQANISVTPLDQQSSGHLEVGVLWWHTQSHTHRDGHGDSITDPAQRSKSMKIVNLLGISKESNTYQFLLFILFMFLMFTKSTLLDLKAPQNEKKYI